MTSHSDDLSFPVFWRAWPYRVGRAAAERAWAKLTGGERATALRGLRRQLANGEIPIGLTRQEYRDRFTPHPSTWINQRRGEDEEQDKTLRCVGYKGKCFWPVSEDDAAEITRWQRANAGRTIPLLCADCFQKWKRDNAAKRGESNVVAIGELMGKIGAS